MDRDVYDRVWGVCRPAQEFYPAIRVSIECPKYVSEDVCHLEQCVWTGTSCVMDYSHFLGNLLVGAGVMQEQAMQCSNPFRTTLGQPACDAYRLIPSSYSLFAMP
jgi:hypothetical protein